MQLQTQDELAECRRVFLQLEADREDLLNELANWPPTRLEYRPASDTWSAVEVLDHIMRAETGTVTDIRAGLRSPHVLGSEQRPRIAELDRALRSEQRFQVPPEAATIRPDAHANFA